MRVLITIPFNSRVPILAGWLGLVLKWVYASRHHVEIWCETTPNRMDWSISACIQEAKDRNWDLWIRMDADTSPATPLDECIERVYANKKLYGFDVTAVPTIMSDGVIQARFLNEPFADPPNGLVVPAEPIEALWISGSLVFTPKHVFSKMEPVGEYVYRDGRVKNFYIQPQHPGATEDVDFCERVRALGFKVCGDPRIRAGQDRPKTQMPSLQAGMTFGGTAEVVLQEYSTE